ncbi:MAG: hypothetical protein M1821_005105 [Bathelium mastoideum]|nr:MAG: hypothetical protein M1821_005105 [Bathelium mastoideum]
MVTDSSQESVEYVQDHRSLDPETRAEIERLVEDQWKPQAIAEKLGLSKKTVSAALRSYKRHRSRPPRPEAVRRGRPSKLTAADEEALFNWLRQVGWHDQHVMVKFFRYERGREVSQSKISRLIKQRGWSREQFCRDPAPQHEGPDPSENIMPEATDPILNSPSASIEDLSSNISKNAALVTGFLRRENYSQPSFLPSGSLGFPKDTPEEVSSARRELIFAARQLQFLALGPTEALQWYALTGALDTASLRWLNHFNVPAAVPTIGAISYPDLSSKLNLSQRVLTRVIRHAMTNNLFIESSPGYVAHTSLSLLLAQPDNPIRGVVGHQTEVVFPAVSRMVEAHERYGTYDEKTTHAPFNEAFGTPLGALDWVARDQMRSERLTMSMKGGASSGPSNTTNTVKAFDWLSLGEGLVVGGSAGQISKAIAAFAPKLRFIVQDQLSMVVQGQADLTPEFKDRMTFQAHNFFEPNPVIHANVYFLRLILHDWPDEDAIRILQNIVVGMAPHSRILINDSIVPPPGVLLPFQEKYIRNADMMMMSMFNALERSIEDWESLIERADSQLKIVRITKPEGSTLSMLEVMKT